jgi:hypothetical protein
VVFFVIFEGRKLVGILFGLNGFKTVSIMVSFLDINKHKMLFVLKYLSLGASVFVLTIFVVNGLAKNEYPDLEIFLIVLISASIVLPLLFIGFFSLGWLYKRSIRNKMCKKRPFDELDKIGFKVSYLNENKKWVFTEEIKEIVIDNYRIQCDVNRDSSSIIEFKAFVQHKGLDKERFERVKKRFKEAEIYFDFDGLIKKYNIKKITSLTIEQLNTELLQFVQTLKSEEFEPNWK